MNLMKHSFVVVRLFQQNNTRQVIVVSSLSDESRSLGFSTLNRDVLTIALLSVLLHHGFLSILYVHLSLGPALDVRLFLKLLIAGDVLFNHL